MNAAFGIMINDETLFYKNFADNVLPYRTVGIFNPSSASSGLNQILNEMDECGYEIGILIHQDVELHPNWLAEVWTAINRLPSDWLVAGVWGVKCIGDKTSYFGHIVDSRIARKIGADKPVAMYADPLPQTVDALDEVCLIVNLKHGFRFNPAMKGFDLYGTYICLWAKKHGYSAWAINARLTHNTKRSWAWKPDQAFAHNWEYLGKEFPSPEYNVVSTVYC